MNIYMTIAAIIGWIALGLQFYLTISYSLSIGISFIGGVIKFFSYFTIQNNLLVAFSYTIILIKPESGLGRFFSSASVKTAIALYITIVGLLYNLLLRQLWNPKGLGLVVDELLHVVTPILYIIYWFIFVPKGVLQWKNALTWLIYPATYLVYVLIRGSLTGQYPYPFINASELGYSRLILNIIMLMFVFLMMGLLFVAINRWMDRSLVHKQEIKDAG